MNFAIFRCCPTNILLKQYEASTDAVLRMLDTPFTDIQAFGCCGYPLKNINFKAYILSSARNLALSEDRKVSILTFCNCCFGNLKHAQKLMQENSSLKDEINAALQKEGLEYKGDAQVMHLFEVLFDVIGLDAINEKLVKTFSSELKIATHYGCHLLRPSQTVKFDSPVTPSLFDQLVEITGARSIEWTAKLDCCGSPVLGVYDELSMDLTEKKVVSAMQSGAGFLCVACPYCQMQFDGVQKKLQARRKMRHTIPSILFTQLVGVCLGIDGQKLGIDQHNIDIQGVMNFFA
jgi:heterodisulfide reductase subunit B